MKHSEEVYRAVSFSSDRGLYLNTTFVSQIQKQLLKTRVVSPLVICLCIILSGCSTPQQKHLARQHKLANKSDVSACLALAEIYEKGDGVPADIEKAIYWYQEAGKMGNAVAALRLAEMYEKGDGVPADIEKAIYWYQEAGKMGNAVAALYEKAINLYKKAGQHGDAGDAIDLLRCVQMCEKGAVVPLDIEEERYRGSYRSAGEMENIDAALCEKAINRYKEAGKKGDAIAFLCLAQMYEKGDGVPADIEKAIYWYQEAGKMGNVDAALRLVQMYGKGDGVPADIEKARYWHAVAGQKAGGKCLDRIVKAYRIMGVPADIEKAIYCYQEAGKTGNAIAIASLRLAEMYEKGDGVPKDIEQALSWYQKAGDKVTEEICLRLAEMYEKGDGVPKDIEQALSWYQKSNNKLVILEKALTIGNEIVFKQLSDYVHLRRKYEADENLTSLQKYELLREPDQSLLHTLSSYNVAIKLRVKDVYAGGGVKTSGAEPLPYCENIIENTRYYTDYKEMERRWGPYLNKNDFIIVVGRWFWRGAGKDAQGPKETFSWEGPGELWLMIDFCGLVKPDRYVILPQY
ncbi:MAG: SEL1-like repeat protein [Kiritimatiellia bacterium]